MSRWLTEKIKAMKRKEFADFKTKTAKELVKFVMDKKAEMAKKKVEIYSGREKNLKYFNNLRREVAQAMTLIKQKEIVEALKPVETK